MNRFFSRDLAVWACLVSTAACAAPKQPGASEPSPAASAVIERVAAQPIAQSPPPFPLPRSLPALGLERRFQAQLAGQRDLEFGELERQLSLARKPDQPLSFNPEAARYAALALDKLALSPEERATFRRDGVVNVDHQQRYSMGAGAAAKDAPAVRSVLGNDTQAKLIMSKIAQLVLETGPGSAIYGGERPIDYSQFRPRGHYTASPQLSRYFQTMIWLGRADTGFLVAPPDPNTDLRVDAERELRSAALLALVLEQSGELAGFEAMAEAVDFLVGGSDDLSIQQLLNAIRAAGTKDPSALEQTANVVALQQRVAQLGRQQIRSQVLNPLLSAEAEVPPPSVFQLFGQRSMVDSFVLSRVVYDSIDSRDKKIRRSMPTGLDVMAALGNDEATRLLRPELELFKYSSNLLAARRTVDQLRPEEFEQSVASLWLDSLRKLDDVPSGRFPEVMRRTPFLRKQLQTQLASWAELRHDTVLYAKQSYTGGILCEYPEGYVEPYPEFFARLALLAKRAGQGRRAIERRAQPARPPWWKQAFPADARQRTLAGEGPHPKESDPRVLALEALQQKANRATGNEERMRLYQELSKREQAARKPPLPAARSKP